MYNKKINKGMHLHRIQPILFSGDPVDENNIVFLTRLQHAEYVVFWNRVLKKHINERNNK